MQGNDVPDLAAHLGAKDRGQQSWESRVKGHQLRAGRRFFLEHKNGHRLCGQRTRVARPDVNVHAGKELLGVWECLGCGELLYYLAGPQKQALPRPARTPAPDGNARKQQP